MESANTDEPRSNQRSSGLVRTLVIACLAFAAIDVLLVMQNRELRARVEAYARIERSQTEQRESTTLVGMSFPSGPLRDEQGGLFELQGTPTLLFISSPNCDLCELAAPHWSSAFTSLELAKTRALGLVLEVAPEKLKDSDYSYPVLATEDLGTQLFRYLDGVPASVILDADGVVERVIYGTDQPGLDQAVIDLITRRSGN